MAETLGSLVDKLAIVDLKLWHCQEQLFSLNSQEKTEEIGQLQTKNNSLLSQRERLIREIDAWAIQAITQPETVVLKNPQNKIYGRFKKD